MIARLNAYAVRSKERLWERRSGTKRAFLASLKRAGPLGPARNAPPAAALVAVRRRDYPDRNGNRQLGRS